ncbi:MAG TPA: sensor histidine kinase [Nitrospira sp.]|nr:sensor histidine kinase [Nitrospira sp.]
MKQTAQWTIPATTIVMAGGIFTVDFLSPLGYAVWLAYLFPLWLSPRAPYRHYPSIFAGLSTFLILADLVVSTAGIDPQVAVFNRGFGIVVIWIMALLLEQRTRAEWLRQRLLSDLERAQEGLRQLSHRLLQAQENERRHIARDLHDEIGQALTALKLNLREVQGPVEPAPIMTLVTDCLEITDQLIQRIRNLALDLRPSLLDELGLVSALHWYVTRQAERAGWTIDYAAQEFEHRLSQEIEIICFRVAQEALTNVMRHAKATHLRVALAQKGQGVELVVQDNGLGFDVDKARARSRTGQSLGLLGMEERVYLAGGTIDVQSRPQEGTTITVLVPHAIGTAALHPAPHEVS